MDTRIYRIFVRKTVYENPPRVLSFIVADWNDQEQATLDGQRSRRELAEFFVAGIHDEDLQRDFATKVADLANKLMAARRALKLDEMA